MRPVDELLLDLVLGDKFSSHHLLTVHELCLVLLLKQDLLLVHHMRLAHCFRFDIIVLLEVFQLELLFLLLIHFKFENNN